MIGSPFLVVQQFQNVANQGGARSSSPAVSAVASRSPAQMRWAGSVRSQPFCSRPARTGSIWALRPSSFAATAMPSTSGTNRARNCTMTGAAEHTDKADVPQMLRTGRRLPPRASPRGPRRNAAKPSSPPRSNAARTAAGAEARTAFCRCLLSSRRLFSSATICQTAARAASPSGAVRGRPRTTPGNARPRRPPRAGPRRRRRAGWVGGPNSRGCALL